MTNDGKMLHGKISNTPEYVHSIKMGDKVSLSPTELSDWSFYKNERVQGGFTTRVIYKYLSPEEQRKLPEYAGHR